MNRKLAKLVKNLNDDTRALIIDVLDSPIKWDLIHFYQANPFSIHTARGLSNIIGRRSEQVFQEAEQLAENGVLKKVCENGDSSSIYAYEPDTERETILRTLAELSEEDTSLLDELHKLLKGETALA
ncbi:MAG TPA: hypothetical protein VGK02_09340 [Candidatus Aquicultor sp.]|jgi:hypothetical protein